jgi:hypothetical protein
MNKTLTFIIKLPVQSEAIFVTTEMPNTNLQITGKYYINAGTVDDTVNFFFIHLFAMASGKPQQTVLVCTTNMSVATTGLPYLFCTCMTHTHTLPQNLHTVRRIENLNTEGRCSRTDYTYFVSA